MKLLICMFGTIKLRGKNMKKLEVLFFDKMKLELILKIYLGLSLSIFCLLYNGQIDTPTKELVFRATKMAQRRHSEPLYSKSEGVLVTVLVLLQFA